MAEENKIFLNTQKEIVLKTKDKYCGEDIKITPLLQDKTVTSRGIVTPDEGYIGFGSVTVDVPDGVDPTGEIELTENKTTYNVREYAYAYVKVKPEDYLDLYNSIYINSNGTYVAEEQEGGITKAYKTAEVKLPGNNMPYLSTATIETNGEHYPDSQSAGINKARVDVHASLENITIKKNGTYLPKNSDAFDKVFVSVPEPDIGNGKYLVRCVDYDGKVLKHRYLNTGDEFVLPSIPDHGGRLNHEELPQTITVGKQDITISPVYYPTSGCSEFDISLSSGLLGVFGGTGKTVTFDDLTFTGDKYIDWGDGTTYDGSLTHTYADYGDYTIKIKNISTIGTYVFGQHLSSSSIMKTIVKRVFLDKTVKKISDYAFQYCSSIESITIPNSVTTIGFQAFYNCTSLSSIAIPGSVTDLGSAFVGCSSLFSVALSDGVTDSGSFKGCHALNSITLPDSLTTIYSSAFEKCYSLRKIRIPKGVTYLNSGIFRNAYAVQEYDFSGHIKVPTLSGTDVFEGINPLCKIIVRDTLYTKWKAAENWSTYAKYIYKASEV